MRLVTRLSFGSGMLACCVACDPAGSTPQGSGQTGSVGPSADECHVAADCQEESQAELDALQSPTTSVSFSGAECINLGISGGPSGPACQCHVAGSDGTLSIGPRGLDCYVLGRSGDCLWSGDEFDDCAPGDSDACSAVCDDLAERLATDAAKVFDAEVQYTACEAQECHRVVRIGDRCFADGSNREGRGYDCALGGPAILAQHEADSDPSSEPLVPDTRSSYVEGTDGVVQLIASRSFVGKTAGPSGFGAMAQFAVIHGSSGQNGQVLDPLEGVDDCGVIQGSGSGAAANLDFYDAAEVLLLDAGTSRPLSLSSASHDDFYQYIAELSEQGVEPRYGQSYGVSVQGGTFGAPFSTDTLRLPEDLVINELQESSHFEQRDLKLTWSGRGSAPLYMSLWVSKSPSDLNNAYQIECLLKDDGEFTIPANVLEAAPTGFVSASFTPEDRHIERSGEHSLLMLGQIQVSHQFALGPICDEPNLMAACQNSAEHVQAAYEQCNLTPPSTAELCPDFVAGSCELCPEYFECVAERTRCAADGFSLPSGCSCPAP